MKKQTFFIYSLYIWLKTLYGIIFHPYLSMLQIRRRPILLPVMFTPFISILFLFLMGRLGRILVDVYGMHRTLIALFLSTTLFSIVFWQLLLFYFLFTFLHVTDSKKH
ncbi:MAG TPA: hypothetical protein VN711_02295 [Candidatus Saccharimonadales bacterium]|nr:hypothetical protein [Candidatus Saccharimonadales bacterium]